MPAPVFTAQKFAVHGLAVEIRSSLPALYPELAHFLNPFAVADVPDGFSAVSGTIQELDPSQIHKFVSPTAKRFASRDLIELYQDGERYWLIDDQWGMVELNILKRQWKSWILPRPGIDAMRCAEMAALWPLAQLLRLKGLYLLPAVSIARGGWGALILSPFSIGPELDALIHAGYRVIGQRWTAIREEDNRLAMLSMPGWVESNPSPSLRSGSRIPFASADRIDLSAKYPGFDQNHSFCDAVFIAEPGRRPTAKVKNLSHSAAVNVLRRSWPLVDLYPRTRRLQLPPKLAMNCRCAELQLSRNPLDLLPLLDDFRDYVPRLHSTSPLTLTLFPQSRHPLSA